MNNVKNEAMLFSSFFFIKATSVAKFKSGDYFMLNETD